MSDIAIEYKSQIKEYDISILNGDLKECDDLDSAVIISLFTWARASAGEVDENAPRFGWFGDKIDADNTDSTGSKLYLLKRKKITNQTIMDSREYIEQALQWMIADGVATEIKVGVERNASDVNRADALVQIIRGDRSRTMKFNDLWSFL